MRSAETMQKAFGFLRPLLSQDASMQKAKVIIATVEGDIHDIGKNIVAAPYITLKFLHYFVDIIEVI